jgi:non-heme chloroperoxidase
MATFETKDGTRLYDNDWGRGQPIVISQGWPLSADAPMPAAIVGNTAVAAGGQIEHLVLMGARASLGAVTISTLTPMIWPNSLPNASLRTRFIGHSTGGGELVRYIGRHGSKCVAKAMLIGAILPLMLKNARQSRRHAEARDVQKTSSPSFATEPATGGLALVPTP